MNAKNPDVTMLMAMLKHNGYVASRPDRYVHPDRVRECLRNGTAKMVEGKWGDPRKHNNPLPDLADRDAWTSGGEYLRMNFSVNEGRLECKVKMYAGCPPEYFRVEFDATLSFEPKCVEMLRGYIVEDFEASMKARHKAYRSEKKRKWMEDEGRKVLGDERYTRTSH